MQDRPAGSVRVLVIDNYDSFTYNLVQCLEALGARCVVRLNDRLTLNDVQVFNPTGVLLSPGPGAPEAAGITLELIQSFAASLPMLGVCLGHQALARAFGAQVVRAEQPLHGKTSPIEHAGRGLFAGVPSPFEATRYHSLTVLEDGLPACLEVTARTKAGEIMALAHRKLPLWGVQFHPESILTQHGAQLVQNWLTSL